MNSASAPGRDNLCLCLGGAKVGERRGDFTLLAFAVGQWRKVENGVTGTLHWLWSFSRAQGKR